MPLDPSIILQGQQPQIQSPLDVAGKAMSMKALADRSQFEGLQLQQAQQEAGDRSALRQAYANNITQDPNGNPVFNRQGFLSHLAQTSPSQVPQQQANFVTMDNNRMKAALEHVTMGAQILNGVTDQNTYDAAKQQAVTMGGDVSQWPPQYDPGIVRSMQNQALTVKDKLENDMKTQEFGLKTAELGIRGKEANVKTAELGLALQKEKAGQNQETLSALQALRGNPALQRAETNVLSAKNLNDLAEQARDPKTGKINLNQLNPQQIALWDHEVIRMASGGTGNEADLEKQEPGTPGYKWAQLHQKITGAVSPANAAPYLQKSLDYANALGKSSNQFLYQNAKHVVDLKKNYLSPQDQAKYNDWLGDLKTGKAFFGEMVGSDSSPQTGKSGASSVASNAQSPAVHPALKEMSLDQLKALEAKLSASKVGSR